MSVLERIACSSGAALCLAAMLSWGPAAAAEPADGTGPPSWTCVSLRPEGAPDLEIFDDFDGDGIRDVLLCDNRTFSLFLVGRDGILPSPSLVFTAPEDAVFLDVGDTDRDGAREPLVLKRNGVFALRPGSGPDRPCVERCIASVKSDLIPSRVERLVFVDFLRDMTGDGHEDLIIPTSRTLEILASHKETQEGAHGGHAASCSFVPWGRIPYTPRATFARAPLSETGRFTEVLHIPQILARGV